MGNDETKTITGGGVLAECIVGRQQIVGHKTYHIAHGKGYVDVDPTLQQPVYAIVDGCGHNTHYAEA